MENTNIDCQNCEQPFEENFDFCPHCGQKSNEDLTISVLFYNTISNYFSFDARFLKSFFPLMFKPGYLAKRFLEGKRLLYLHPAQMYLFVSVIFFFLFSFTISDWSKEADKLNERIVTSETINKISEESQLALDSIKKEEILKQLNYNKNILGLSDEDLKETDSLLTAKKGANIKTSWGFDKDKIDSLVAAGADEKAIYKEMGLEDDAGYFKKGFFKFMLNLVKGSGIGAMMQRAFDAIPIAMFFLLPLFAFLLKIFYFKSGRYAHHLVFSFYFFSFLFTLFALLLGIDRFVYPIPGWISTLIVLSVFIYFYLSILNFYKRNWFTTLLKSGVITFVFMLMVIPLAALILILFGVVNS